MKRLSSKELHEQLEKEIKREMHQAESHQKEAEVPKKLYGTLRFIEIGLATYVGYLYFYWQNNSMLCHYKRYRKLSNELRC